MLECSINFVDRIWEILVVKYLNLLHILKVGSLWVGSGQVSSGRFGASLSQSICTEPHKQLYAQFGSQFSTDKEFPPTIVQIKFNVTRKEN